MQTFNVTDLVETQIDNLYLEAGRPRLGWDELELGEFVVRQVDFSELEVPASVKKERATKSVLNASEDFEAT